MARDSFGSRFGALVAMAGSAVGLGNLWRFPHLVGDNGGAAFIIVYILLCFVLCLPIFISEFVIGRRSQKFLFFCRICSVSDFVVRINVSDTQGQYRSK